MPPAEYVSIDSLDLYGWCDFDLSSLPVWGLRATKGDPAILIPHADDDLPVEVHGTGVGFTLLGVVYGDTDQDQAPVTNDFATRRLQLADNIDALGDLSGGAPKTITYILFEREYTGDVTVQGLQQATSGPLDNAATSPLEMPVALKLYLAAGVMTQTGS